MTYSKQVVIVTGATSGIGEAVVQALASTEASIVGRDKERGQRALESVQKLNCPAELMLGDVTDSAFADHVINFTVERFGKVSGIVNSAGVMGVEAPLRQLTMIGIIHSKLMSMACSILAAPR
ncbi:SDR family oxidoreductase [Mesorhizobium sp. M0809]